MLPVICVPLAWRCSSVRWWSVRSVSPFSQTAVYERREERESEREFRRCAQQELLTAYNTPQQAVCWCAGVLFTAAVKGVRRWVPNPEKGLHSSHRT